VDLGNPVPFWIILLELSMMKVEVITVTTRRAKLQSNRRFDWSFERLVSSPPTNQHPALHTMVALPVTQPTVSKH